MGGIGMAQLLTCATSRIFGMWCIFVWMRRIGLLAVFAMVLHMVSMPCADAARRNLFNQGTDFQIWSPVYLWARHGKVRLMLEANPRVGVSTGHMDQLLLRPALGYQLTPTVSVWQGYGWTPSWLPSFVNETRLWQQVMVENKFQRFAMVNRTRLEERYIEHLSGRTGVRMRHFLRLQAPFKEGSRWSGVIYDELFVNLNKVSSGITPGINQNRLFVGVNRKVNEHMNVDCGYQYQYINRNFPTEDRNNHVLLFNWNFVVN